MVHIIIITTITGMHSTVSLVLVLRFTTRDTTEDVTIDVRAKTTISPC